MSFLLSRIEPWIIILYYCAMLGILFLWLLGVMLWQAWRGSRELDASRKALGQAGAASKTERAFGRTLEVIERLRQQGDRLSEDSADWWRAVDRRAPAQRDLRNVRHVCLSAHAH